MNLIKVVWSKWVYHSLPWFWKILSSMPKMNYFFPNEYTVHIYLFSVSDETLIYNFVSTVVPFSFSSSIRYLWLNMVFTGGNGWSFTKFIFNAIKIKIVRFQYYLNMLTWIELVSRWYNHIQYRLQGGSRGRR